MFSPVGTGKSSVAMSLACASKFKKCVSTDTIREIARCYSGLKELHRPSYGGVGDRTVADWEDSVSALQTPIASVVDHTLRRRKSMILEGVSLSPSNGYIDRWRELGGVAIGVLVKVSDRKRHHDILTNRGYYKQIENFERIRVIQEEMMLRAAKANWLQLELDDLDSMVNEINIYLQEHEKKDNKEGDKNNYNYESMVSSM
jgi:2-phosphoglycerate kinase